MKIGVMSDLHNEFDRGGQRKMAFERPDGHPPIGPSLLSLKGKAELLLMAGDIDVGLAVLDYASQAAGYLACPAVLVAGNHEFYHGVHAALVAGFRQRADSLDNVHFLENDVIELALAGSRVRIAGATLWTDYALYGDDWVTVANAMKTASNSLSDHFLIGKDADGGLFLPSDALDAHIHSREWLASMLKTPFDGATVVMTHHAVSGRAIPERFRGDALSPAFASNLDDMVAGSGVPLWVTGHTHHDIDFAIGNTRVLSRQRGYPHEAKDFAPALVEI